MTTRNNQSIEEQFGLTRKKESKEFHVILIVILLFLFLLGFIAHDIKARNPKAFTSFRALKTSFTMPKQKEKPKPPKVIKKKPKPKPKPQKEPEKVYDLTKNPVLQAKVDVEAPKEPQKKKPKPIYGVKTVYSKGLGKGGSMEDAVVGKQGNTTNKAFDTTVATEKDLLGEVVAASTITQAPKFKKRVKPKITAEIKKSGVSGVVRVKVLVDIDGKVKKAIATNDLGFGTKEEAIKACLKMEFSPAYRKKEKVAVWIIIPIRFEKLG